MVNDKSNQLKKLLSNIPNAYQDFIDGIALFAKIDNVTDDLIAYLETGEDLTKNDVFRKYHELTGDFEPPKIV